MSRRLTITVNVPDSFDHAEGADEVRRATQEYVDANWTDEREEAAAAEPCDWFAWIGQSFAHCDRCGRPAWEHKGEESFLDGRSLFDQGPPASRPWAPGEADAIRRKWGQADA